MARFESFFGCLPDQAPLEASSSQPDQAPASEFFLLSSAATEIRSRRRATDDDEFFFPTSVPEKPMPQTFQEQQWEFSVCRMRSATPVVPPM